MILDYLKRMKGATIVVPPYHTGHLGYLPGTEVSVGLTAGQEPRETHCELVVTPIGLDPSQMSRLTCTMLDRPGVVNRLLEAISSLGVNVAKEENSGIDHLNHHVVEVLLDWRGYTLGSSARITPGNMVRRYQEMCPRIPIHYSRYIHLYQAIMSMCGDVVLFDDIHGTMLPAITIAPYAPAEGFVAEPHVTKVYAHEKRNVQLSVPDNLLARIVRVTNHSADESIPYILSSETDTRSLRVFFPRKEIIPRIVHVNFVHSDAPGALSAITAGMAGVGFNMLTGLLRKKDQARSAYEVILDCVSDRPPVQEGPEMLEWVRAKIANSSAELRDELAHFKVSVSYPDYPTTKFEPLELPIESPDPKLRERSELDKPVLLLSRIRSVEERAPPPGETPESERQRARFLRRMHETMTQKSRIFLSYPRLAQDHARLLRRAFSERFENEPIELTPYEPNFSENVEAILDQIGACDFFIGIWHHEELNMPQAAAFTVSPWMPFEYGVALRAGVECIVVHSDKLDKAIWQRIRPGIDNPEYSDVTFLEVMIPKIMNYIETKWLARAARAA